MSEEELIKLIKSVSRLHREPVKFLKIVISEKEVEVVVEHSKGINTIGFTRKVGDIE